MLGMIILTLAMVVGMLLFMMLKRPKGQQREIQQLLDEAAAMAEQDADEAEFDYDAFESNAESARNPFTSQSTEDPNSQQADPRAPWEKEPDWWK